MFSLPHFGRQGSCHDITKSADSQTNINFSENDCIIADILQKRLSNEWLQTEEKKLKLGEKTQIGWTLMLVASQLSRNNCLIIVVKIYTEANFPVFSYCPSNFACFL